MNRRSSDESEGRSPSEPSTRLSGPALAVLYLAFVTGATAFGFRFWPLLVVFGILMVCLAILSRNLPATSVKVVYENTDFILTAGH